MRSTFFPALALLLGGCPPTTTVDAGHDAPAEDVDRDVGEGDAPVDVTADGGTDAGVASPLFFDDYDYVVTPDPADAAANRMAFWAAGYTRIKAENVDDAGEGGLSTQRGGAGELYTVDVSEIPSHTGAAPGSTSRALCIHSMAGSMAAQTDFYFQVGDALGDIPANVYFQFWVWVARSGAQMTELHGREKFIYPTRNTYPATVGTDGAHWLFELSTSSSSPFDVTAAPGEVFALSRDGTISSSTPSWPDADAVANGTTAHLGQTVASPLWTPNRWIETRIHYDTSGENGVYQVWTRGVGEDWALRTEWIGGTTVDGTPFTWTIDPRFRDGHAAIRVPTTMPGPGSTTPEHDAWIYLQDFAMAGTVADLPRYEGR